MPLFVLSRLLSSLWVSRTGSASDWCALQEALYKCIDTIQYSCWTCARQGGRHLLMQMELLKNSACQWWFTFRFTLETFILKKYFQCRRATDTGLPDSAAQTLSTVGTMLRLSLCWTVRERNVPTCYGRSAAGQLLSAHWGQFQSNDAEPLFWRKLFCSFGVSILKLNNIAEKVQESNVAVWIVYLKASLCETLS